MPSGPAYSIPYFPVLRLLVLCSSVLYFVVLHIPVLYFPAVTFSLGFSSPVYSSPAFSLPPSTKAVVYQNTRKDHCLKLAQHTHTRLTAQVCTVLQTDNHTSTPPLCFFTGRMPFLPLNQQRQSTEGKVKVAQLGRKTKELATSSKHQQESK